MLVHGKGSRYPSQRGGIDPFTVPEPIFDLGDHVSRDFFHMEKEGKKKDTLLKLSRNAASEESLENLKRKTKEIKGPYTIERPVPIGRNPLTQL